MPSSFVKPRIFELGLKILGRSSSQISILMRSVEKGDVVFDVGANVGEFTILLAHSVGFQGKIHAFEPVPPTFERLCRKVEMTRLGNQIVLNRCAVSDNTGRSTIRMPAGVSTEASLVTHSVASWCSKSITSYDCAMDTLDSYARNKGIDSINFVKIDVEGAEILVLKGMRAILAGSSPPILMLEIFPPWVQDFGFSPNDIFELLHNAGYQMFFISRVGLLSCQTPADITKLVSFPNFVDFLCLQPKAHYKTLANLVRFVPIIKN